MESASLSTPISAPQFRGFRRASEISIASQVSGMADSYTASNIANSKCFTPLRHHCCLGTTPRAGLLRARATQLLSVRLSVWGMLSINNNKWLTWFCHSTASALEEPDGNTGVSAALCMLDCAAGRGVNG